MTYSGVLTRFIGIPLFVLAGMILYDQRKGRRPTEPFRTLAPWVAVAVHVTVALVYTTPWDNYLVATRVWWYDPTLVMGITLGFVPIEEYAFFVLQTLITELWLLLWMHRARQPGQMPPLRGVLRWLVTGAVGLIWAIWLGLLVGGWERGRYMALILVWALPPIGLQLACGADILWRHRGLVLAALFPPTIYLWFVDGLAIRSGTWAINPARTLGINLGGILPVEEAAFFLVTNTLVVFGTVLLLARESHRRLKFLAR